MYNHLTEIYHYGMPRRSGRYPWGSGDRPYQSLSTGKIIKKVNKTQKKVDSLSTYREIQEQYKKSEKNLLERAISKSFRWLDVLNERINKQNIKRNSERLESLMDELNIRDVKLDSEKIVTVSNLYNGILWHKTTAYKEKK